METAGTVILFIIGLVFIIKGGDFFVDAASWFAEVSGIPKLIVGATVVSIATTLPELLVSTFAAAEGKIDMAIGNAVGSVTANIGLIMAISLLCLPSTIRRKDYLFKSLLMLAASAVIVASGALKKLYLPLSVLLLAMFAVFFAENIISAKKAVKSDGGEKAERPKANGKTVVSNIVKFLIGTVGIVWGAQLMVDNGSALARLAGISERIIGVTIIAVGTSLPELITTVTAVAKKQSALSVGNIIGANIIDLTLILPLSSVISGKALPFDPVSSAVDLPACLLVGIVAVIPAIVSQKFSRWQGACLLGIYAVYLALTCFIIA